MISEQDTDAERLAYAGSGQGTTHPSEWERTRLSRELHDDIAQRIALLSAELAMLRQRLTEADGDIQEDVARMAAETASLGADLHQIVRGLHPSELQRSGLGPSLRRHCSRLAKVHGLTIELDMRDLSPGLDLDTALCLYRVGQEALHNVVKHSGASHATVSLTTTGEEVVLRIVDRGVGFDTSATCSTDTLGLISMRERARLLNARLLVYSRPGEGTSVEIRVPLAQSFTCTSA